jgi:hypothetical protein
VLAHFVDSLRRSERAFLAAVFVSLLGLLAALGPGSARWMGYAQEEYEAAFRAVELALAGGPFDRAHLGDLPNRHGVVAVATRIPWALLALPFRDTARTPESPVETRFARDDLAAEAILSFATQIETAALVTLLAAWILRVSGDRRRALLYSFATLFCTFLWPYAYIGMESLPALAFFVLAFLAIGPTRLSGRRRDIAVGVAFVLAFSVKSIAILLAPVGAWLLYRSARRSAAESGGGLVLPAALTIAGALVLRLLTELAIRSYLLRHPILGPGNIRFSDALPIYLVDSPLVWLAHLHGFFLSANKGVLVFAPLALIGLWRAASGQVRPRDLSIFALGTAACMALPLAALSVWSDETWGPRYLAVAVAPACLALALSRAVEGVAWRLRRVLLRGAVAFGLAVNLLGVLVFYGTLAGTAWAVEPTSLGTFQTDLRWNHPRFNVRILSAWIENLREPGMPATFANPVPWWLVKAPDAREPRTVRLGKSAAPQPAILRVLVSGEEPRLVPFAVALVAAGILGAALLVLLLRAARGPDRISPG